MATKPQSELHKALAQRFDTAPVTDDLSPTLTQMAGRGSCRAFLSDPVPTPLLETLSAVALSSPTKSDLQQRDIILITSPMVREQLAALVPGQAWVTDAPVLAVFCGNNRRQRQLHDWHNVPFANDHLDAFFNASVDAAIALSAFVTAAEAVGLGCCPISAMRNDAQAVSDALNLPDHVFPIAGLAVGYPAQPPRISKRLPLGLTVHHNQFSEFALKDKVQSYDTARAEAQPIAAQRFASEFGTSENYGWSEDKARQYSQPERDNFGQFVRAKGFSLD